MGPIWDPSGQPAYELTHMGPMPNSVALPIWVPYGFSKRWLSYRGLTVYIMKPFGVGAEEACPLNIMH